MIDLEKRSDAVNILWTGGWDSTFNLCKLVLLKKVKVQPFYIIDADRRSFPIEIKTMDKIKSLLIDKDNSAKERILPTFLFFAKDVKENSRITEQSLNLKKKYHLGSQYDWLARFLDQFNISDMEISSHTLRTPHVISIDNDQMIKHTGEDDMYLKMADKPDDPDLVLFKNFKFVNMHLSKVDAQKIAKKEGFLDIMHETWFCHKPTKSLKPCGMCHPCLITIQEGMSYRFPKIALLKALIKRQERKILSSQNRVAKKIVCLLKWVRDYLRKEFLL